MLTLAYLGFGNPLYQTSPENILRLVRLGHGKTNYQAALDMLALIGIQK